MTSHIKQKCIVITGVAGGMGAEAADRFIREGFRVFGIDIRRPGSEKGGPGMTFIQADLTDMTSVQAAFTRISAETDRISCIINMAGMYDLDSLVEVSEEEFLRVFNVNLFSIYRMNRTFLPLLEEGGRIIITSSELAPLDPLPFTGLYAVTKAAVEKYAFALRMELQLLDKKVIVIRPGAVDTRFIGISTDRLDRFCEKTEHYSVNALKFRQIVDRVEARKVPPEKVADTVYRASQAKRPRYVYRINRNPLLLLLNMLPGCIQTRIIGRILRQS